VKDLAAEGQLVDEDGWADVGHGIMNWAALLPVMQETSADVWVLEHDNPSDDARFASKSIAAVKSW
jgi:sugar phosphate isomerase/epimerase